jgi:phosphatidylglycerophosphate synthase
LPLNEEAPDPMIDGWAKGKIDPLLMRLALPLARLGVTANAVTVAGCLVGLAGALAVAAGHAFIGLLLIVASRLADGLDGAVARLTGPTDLGGFLDIVLDFVFYGAVPLGFVLADPSANAAAGAALIFSFYVNGASFLAFAAIAEKRRLKGAARGAKSIYFTTGLAEAGETLAFFAAFCLFPQWFAPLAWLFAALCLYTALARIGEAFARFRE